MNATFEHRPRPRIAERKKAGPPKTRDEHVGLNGEFAHPHDDGGHDVVRLCTR